MRSYKLTQFAQVVVILSVALAIKYFYSTASVNDLRWILAPTTFLVETITGIQFRFESHAGYMSEDRTFLIAQPCSGVNFLIIAFVMLTVGKLWREWPGEVRWRSLMLAMFVAYPATLLANTARIIVALETRSVDLGFEYESVHRIEGIVIYFGSLLLLFLVIESFATRKSSIVLPLAVYFAVALGIPIAGGAFRDAAFWDHAIVVLATSTLVILPFVVLYLWKASHPRTGKLFQL